MPIIQTQETTTPPPPSPPHPSPPPPPQAAAAAAAAAAPPPPLSCTFMLASALIPKLAALYLRSGVQPLAQPPIKHTPTSPTLLCPLQPSLLCHTVTRAAPPNTRRSVPVSSSPLAAAEAARLQGNHILGFKGMCSERYVRYLRFDGKRTYLNILCSILRRSASSLALMFSERVVASAASVWLSAGIAARRIELWASDGASGWPD
jgi:hypothetical protein